MADAMTVEAAAAELGVATSTVRSRLQRGVMRGERVGARLWLVPRDEVERWRSRGRLAPGRKPSSAAPPPTAPSPLVARLNALRSKSTPLDGTTADLVNEGRAEREQSW